jgi:large subunit ribosomal protein L21
MYAIVRTGGKQYRVEEGRAVQVDRLSASEGERVELTDVLLIGNEDDVLVGTPTVEGARVLAEVERQGRDKKIVVFKYKAKVRTRKKTGHRQPFTRLLVQEILRPGQKEKKGREASRASEAATDAGDEAEAPKPKASRAAAATAAPANAEAAAPPRRSPSRKAASAPSGGDEKKTRAKRPAPKAKAPDEKKPTRRTRAKKDE